MLKRMLNKAGHLCVVILALMTFTCTVSAETITIESNVLDKILKHQKVMEKKIKMLEKKSGARKAAPDIKKKDMVYLKEDVDEISVRLDKIETKSILNRVSLSGDFRMRYENFHYNNYKDSLTGLESDSNVDDIWTNRLRLNLKAEITDNLVFHGRLTTFKLWGDSNFNRTGNDVAYPSLPDTEGDIHLERAYVDWFVPGTPLSFTFGRLPTGEGPPNELKDFTTRKATWPKLVVDGEIDGIIANISLDRYTGLNNSMFRFVYSKFYQNYSKFQGIDLEDSRALTFAFETEVPGIKNSMFWLSYVKMLDMPALTELPASYPLTVISYPEDIGEMDLYTGHLQLFNIANTGLDWFCSLSYLNINPVAKGTLLSNGVEYGLFGDSAGGNLGSTRKGYAVYSGLRYKLPVEALQSPSIGIEYNHGTKNWTSMLSDGSGDLVNKLGVNGDAYEIYYIQPVVKKHMFCRTGIVYMDYDHYNPMSIYGSQQDSDMSITNMYFLVNVSF